MSRLLRIRWAARQDGPELLVKTEDLRFGIQTPSHSLAMAMGVRVSDAKPHHVPYLLAADGWLAEVVVLSELAEMRLAEVVRREPRSPRGTRGHVLQGVPDLAGDPPASAVLGRFLGREGLRNPGVPVEPVLPQRFSPVAPSEFKEVLRSFLPGTPEGGAA